MTQAKLWIIAALLFIAVAVVAVIKVWPMLHPDVSLLAPLDPNCDLRAGPCTSSLPGGGEVSFSIAPEEIPLVQPLTLKVEVSGIAAQSAEIDFVGIGMEMGFNRPKLKALGGGSFSGEGMLPVCIREAMEWEARVLLNTPDGLVAAPYRFITIKEGVVPEGASSE